MVQVEVINGTGEEIVIKEGNAGIYKEVQRIQKDGNTLIRVDENATYREIMCVETKSELTVTLNSDDCIDFAAVLIKYVDNSKTKLCFDPIPRKTGGLVNGSTDAKIVKTVKNASSWFIGLFKK